MPTPQKDEKLTPFQADLVAKNTGLAYRVYRKALARYPDLDENELESAALWGLIRAALNFDPSKAKFSTIATIHCRARVAAEIRRQQDRWTNQTSLDFDARGDGSSIAANVPDASMEE